MVRIGKSRWSKLHESVTRWAGTWEVGLDGWGLGRSGMVVDGSCPDMVKMNLSMAGVWESRELGGLRI